MILVAIEACGSAHHWARLLRSFGHEVKLMPPQYVKPNVRHSIGARSFPLLDLERARTDRIT
jgi:hypothetical protein